MASTNADVVSAQMERIAPKLQELYENAAGLAGKIKKAGPEYKVSTWSGGGYVDTNSNALGAFRIPLNLYPGGDYGTMNYDDGDLGSGSMTKTAMMTIGYFPDRFAVNISSLAQQATASSEQSVIDVFKHHTKKAMKEMQWYYDTGLHQDGRGILATGSGVGSPSSPNPVYNLESTFGPQRLRYNQPVDVFSSDGVTLRGSDRVTSYNLTAKTATLAGTVTSPANTDLICFSGMSPTLAVGSWRNGIYTFQNTATSGYTLGLNRATVVELVTPSYNASSGALVPAFAQILWDQMIQRRDEEQFSGLMGVAHQAQRAAWYLQGLGISEWFRSTSDKMIDLVPENIKYDSTFRMAGVEHMVDKKQDRSRIDWIVPKNFARVLLHPLKFHETPDGRRFFEDRSSSTGNVKAGFTFFLVGTDNVASLDPGAGGILYGLQIPSGY